MPTRNSYYEPATQPLRRHRHPSEPAINRRLINWVLVSATFSAICAIFAVVGLVVVMLHVAALKADTNSHKAATTDEHCQNEQNNSEKDCRIEIDVKNYVCARDNRKFAVWPLTAAFGPEETLRNLTTTYNSEQVGLATGPTGKRGTAHLLGFDADSYIKVTRFGAEWSHSGSFAITFYAENLALSHVPLVEFFDAAFERHWSFFVWHFPTADQLSVSTGCHADKSSLGPVVCPRGQWNFIALSINRTDAGTSVTAYCNDQSATSKALCIRVAGDMYIGKRIVSEDVFKGKMSCLTLHSTALSKADIDNEKQLCQYRFYNNCHCS